MGVGQQLGKGHRLQRRVRGSAVSLDLTVPVPGGNATGQVFNSTGDFPVGGTSGISGGLHRRLGLGRLDAVPGSDRSLERRLEVRGRGLPRGWRRAARPRPRPSSRESPIAPRATGGPLLYAADVANAKIDIFNKDFKPVSNAGKFVDPCALPKGYAPFNIQLLGGDLYVSYGKQNTSKTDVVTGARPRGRGCLQPQRRADQAPGL